LKLKVLTSLLKYVRINRPFSLKIKNSNAWLADPEMRISFLFARCRPTVARAGTVVFPTAAAAVAALLLLALANLLI